MTATDMTAGAMIAAITDEQLEELRSGGWNDIGDVERCLGWERTLEAEAEDGGVTVQWASPVDDGGWESEHRVYADAARRNLNLEETEVALWNSLEEALAKCDELAGDRKPAKPGSPTNQDGRCFD